MASYIILYGVLLILFIVVTRYLFKLKSSLDEMHGMMVGMTVSMIVGLATATLYLIPTGDFLWGVILGTVVGLIFGILISRGGGHLAIMEAVMAGPMGGMMGAMLGQMIRPFNLEIFMPFFVGIILMTLFGLTYMVCCRHSCCEAQSQDDQTPAPHVSEKFIAAWLGTAIILFSASLVMSFQIPSSKGNVQLAPATLSAASSSQNNSNPSSATAVAATLRDGVQEINLTISATGYTPNIIEAKKDIPLRLNVTAEADAGCAREIVFPDFNIDKIVPAGGSAIIEILPTQEGTFPFRCSMDMVRGQLIVKE